MARSMTIAIVAALALGAAAVEHHKVAGVLRKAQHVATTKMTAPPPKLSADAPIPPTVIGMNVNGLSYFGTEYALYDPIRNHAAFSIRGPKFTNDWVDLKDQLPRDANGGLLHVPKDTDFIVQAGSVRNIGAKLICHISPGWQVSTLVATATINGNEITVMRGKDAKDDDRWSFILHAPRDDMALTDLSCRPVGVPAGAMFRPEFLADLKPFGVIRFMNWMRANNEPETSWAQRPKPSDLTYVEKGMPVEIMVELANQLHSDPWFTLPFGADDEYQRKFASYVHDHLDPNLKVYAELSNEIWNNSFPQSKQATMLGKARYPAEDDAHANDYYYGDRVRHMMGIWSEVFAGHKQRLVRVASTQAGWPDRADYILSHADTAKSVDVLAIAPYFGEMPFDVPGTGKARVDGILARMPQQIEKQIANAKQSKAFALKYGVRLVTYEAGSAIDAYTPEMMKDVQATLHDPRLEPIYESYITRWTKEVGGEMVLFDLSDGVWGHVDYVGQPVREMPKMTAALNVIAGLPQGQARGVKPIAPTP